MVPHGVALFGALCVTIALCTSSVSSQWSHIIYLNNENGSDTEECLMSSSVFSPCATLQYAVSGLRNSTQIQLSGGIHSIDDTINIRALHNISLSGMSADHPGLASSGSTVYCQNGSNAGLKFVDVSDLHISKLVFMNCGSPSASTTRGEIFEMMALFRIAVLILNSTDIYVESTAFVDNRGIGLTLFDTAGHVSILNSDFTGNSVPQDEKLHNYSGGGGLYIEHTYCSPGLLDCNYRENSFSSNSTVIISHCHFAHNIATTLPQASSTLVHQEKTISRRLGQGAAISLTLKGMSYGNNITISKCLFKSNSARYGGAVNVNFQDHATNNQLLFQNCWFADNHAEDGGGGLFVGIFFYEGDTVVGNHIYLDNTDFASNTGAYGGGAHFAISQMRDSRLPQNSISFTHCAWRYNSAKLGGALLFVPEAWNTFTDGSLPIPVFSSCFFSGNWISTSAIDSSNSSTLSTEGVVFSSTITMNFTKTVVFENNQGTALSIAGGSINILDNTLATFRSNSGSRGGALVLLDFASLRLFPGSKVLFKFNTATEYGGAIYASSHNDLDFYFSRSCFIHYSDVRVPTQDWDTKINFEKNYVGQSYLSTESDCDPLSHNCIAYNPKPVRLPHNTDESVADLKKGSSIYAESVQPCKRAADTTGNFTPSNEHMFPLGVFEFDEYCNITSDPYCGIGTTADSLVVGNLDSNGMLTMAPGEKKCLSLNVKDELNRSVYAVVSVSVSESTNPENRYQLDRSSWYVTDDTVQVNGRINETFELTFRTDGPKQVSITVNAQLTTCPPGLVYDNSSMKCICSATTENQRFVGITKCSVDLFRGLLNKGYWAGCYGGPENETLLTAECPLGYCRSGDTDHRKPFYVLPETCEQLDSYLCGPQNRTGSLCGKCEANLSVFFHSQHFNCHNCDYKYGILYYILSELVPVTLLFLCIISFNIHLTSGTWNSVILYAQIIDCFQVNSLQLFESPYGILELTSIYQFIFGWFNFDFFKFDDYLSFCIWDGMTVLDVLAFKYVTTGFALSLLILLILCFRCECWNKCETAWKQCQSAIGTSQHRHSWIIHGISAFLVLSYAQCTKVSFQILTNVHLRGKNHEAIKRVVFLSGDIEYFSLAHLPYAIPALLMLMLTSIPPIILLLYPLKNSIGSHNLDRVQQLCSSENVNCWSVISMNRFKPVIDSFQGCFKDRYRYFAGLFFIYRFLMSLSFALSTNAVTLYVTLEVLLILMLTLHAWAQPYERRFYNLLDTFMFANLATVNALSIYNFYWVNYSSETTNLTVSLAFQTILIYLAILYLLVMCFFLILTGYSKNARHCLRKLNDLVPLFEETAEEMEESFTHSRTESVPFDEEHLPYRMFEDY